MALGVRSLIAHGRKRIMPIAPLIEQSYGTAMIAGVRAADAQAGVELVVMYGLTSNSPVDLIESQLATLLRQMPNLTA